MTQLVWDGVGDHTYETGVDRGVLYLPDGTGAYSEGYAWNGLTGVDEKPTGASASPQYADNIKYLNLISAEQFEATVSAFTYPDEFAQCDGSLEPVPGVQIGQQTRKTFGLSYRTQLGNDVDGTDLGYRIHCVYGALAAPSEKNYQTVNDTPSAIAFSWDTTTTPVDVSGYKPTATVVITSTDVSAEDLAAFEAVLYGSAGADPRLPLPSEIFEMFAGATVETVTPTAPTFADDTITIPSVAGVVYSIDGVEQAAGAVPITENELVVATPADGYTFPAETQTQWGFVPS